MAQSGTGTVPVARMPRLAMAGRAVRPVVSARTWLALIHLMTGAITGFLIGIVIVVCTVTGIALVWFFLLGLPILALMLWLCGQFASLERARFALLLGERLPAPATDLSTSDSSWRQIRRFLLRPATRRQFGYALVRFPLSFAEGCIVAGVWSFGVAMVVLPFYSWLMLHARWHVGGEVPGNPLEAIAGVLLGLAVLIGAPYLTWGVAAADAAVARFLIGPGGTAEMSDRIGQLERSRARVVDAAEAERRRIERDLHDGAQQRLVSLAMNLARARARFPSDPEGAAAIIDEAHTEAKEALAELRNLVRGVHPPVLTDRGLDAAISGLAALCPVPVTVHAEVTPRPPAAVEAIAYFVVAEALTNIAKHARASQASVTVSRHSDVLHVAIRDDGAGGADARGPGLSGLADRVAGVDGRLTTRSPAGGPTVIEVELPCRS